MKATLSGRVLFLFAILLTAGTQDSYATTIYSDVVLADNPVAYWRLNEVGSTSVAMDETGSHAGTYGSGITKSIAGPRPGDLPVPFDGFELGNTGAGFGGTSQGVSVPDHASLRMGVSSGWTMEAWVNISDVATESGMVLAKFDGDFRYRSGYRLGFSNGGSIAGDFRMEIPGQDLGNSFIRTPHSEVLATDRWHHIVAVLHRDMGSGLPAGYSVSGASLYVNGALIGTTVDTKLDGVPIGTHTLRSLGIGNFDDSFPYGDAIDEVALYDYALTSADVAAHYSAAQAVPEPSTWALMGIGAVAVLFISFKRKPRH